MSTTAPSQAPAARVVALEAQLLAAQRDNTALIDRIVWLEHLRRRALRHAMRYRAGARLHTLLVDSLLMSAEVADSEIDALRARVEVLRDTADRATARADGLNLAADQYSESRDRWFLRARALESALRALVTAVDDAMTTNADAVGVAVRAARAVLGEGNDG